MDIYHIRSGAGWDMYCTDCASYFCNRGGDANDVDGPYPNGGGEADLIHHCDRGGKCEKAMQTRTGPVGACFHNELTEVGIMYTLDALRDYTNCKIGTPEVLDLWANELRNYSLSTDESFIHEYDKIRAAEKPGSFDRTIHPTSEDQLVPPRGKKKQDNKVSRMMAFFDDRPIDDAVCCKSCKDTGVIVLFNSSVECTDCSKSWANAQREMGDIPF